MKYTLFFILFLITAQLHTMEKREIQTIVLPKELLTQEIIPTIINSLNTYSNHQYIKTNGKITTLTKLYNYSSSWSKYGYWGNDCIFLPNTSTVVDANQREYLHLINVFEPLKKLISHIRIAEKIACTNKDINGRLKIKISQAKIYLASFILYQTDYKGNIFNMKSYNKSNDFFLQNEHYAIANAIGNYYIAKKDMPKCITEKIQLIIKWTLSASCNTHANLFYFTQEREPSMPENLPTNDRLNVFVLHIFAGMLQASKDKKYTFILGSGRSQHGPGLDNINYIQDTAKEMGIDLNIKYDSFFYHSPSEPCIIEISELENSSLTNCTIQ